MGKALDRLMEFLDDPDFTGNVHGEELEALWGDLERTGQKKWVEAQIRDYLNSHHSNQFSSNRKEALSFLSGSIYGYVLAKTGDRNFASRLGHSVKELTVKMHRHTP